MKVVKLMNGIFLKQSKSENIFDWINHTVLIIGVIITLYPLWYVFIYSISNSSEASKGLFLLPQAVTLQNYVSIFSQADIFSATIISILRTVIGTAITVTMCTMFGFVLTKKLLPFRKLFYILLIITMYINAGLIPWYVTMINIGLKNSFLVYILPTAIVGFYVIIVKTYIEQLPVVIQESALIDGAGTITILIRIIFPLSKPIIATVAIFAAVNQWNMWTDNFFLNPDPKFDTLQLLLYKYLNNNVASVQSLMKDIDSGNTASLKVSEMSIRMAITMVVTVPILLVYPFFQKFFTKGLMLGAVKE
jgi:putative aldouronate transport system permease protein